MAAYFLWLLLILGLPHANAEPLYAILRIFVGHCVLHNRILIDEQVCYLELWCPSDRCNECSWESYARGWVPSFVKVAFQSALIALSIFRGSLPCAHCKNRKIYFTVTNMWPIVIVVVERSSRMYVERICKPCIYTVWSQQSILNFPSGRCNIRVSKNNKNQKRFEDRFLLEEEISQLKAG